MKCPVCEHEAPVADFGDPLRCPECGVFYEKAVIAKAKNSASATISLETAGATKQRPLAPRKSKTFLWVLAAVMVVIGAKVVLPGRSPTTASVPAPVEARKPASISGGALSDYNEADFPKLYSSWGESGVIRIKAAEQKAANHVALSADCNRIEVVQIANQRSYPPREIVIFVDCENGNRFYVGDNELARPPSSLQFKKVF